MPSTYPPVGGTSESCVSQSISPPEEKVDAVEGETVTLSCKYDGNVNNLQWYRQHPGSRPQYLLMIQEASELVTKAENLDARMSIKVHKEEKKVDLEISSAAVSDSVLYYCVFGADVIRPSDDQETDVLRTEGEPLTLKCTYDTSKSCVSQSISPLEENVDAVEGETAALSCRYSGSAYYLFWYRQYPGSRPEFLLRIDPSTKAVRRADPPVPGLDVKLNESCVSQSISPLEEKVDAVEGQTVTLSCRYEGGGNDPSLHWYRQYPGSRPEFLLLTAESGAYITKAENLDARMSIKVHKEEKKKVDLEISSAAVSDSVLYYCALAPTVTGNPDTLYRNWFYD
ncbi:hypothetical protein NFI96_003004 [Prochilodus magdalenae]|nr:hypothetical protein NFI96_003004 [Prochilodus magdalenae]